MHHPGFAATGSSGQETVFPLSPGPLLNDRLKAPDMHPLVGISHIWAYSELVMIRVFFLRPRGTRDDAVRWIL